MQTELPTSSEHELIAAGYGETTEDIVRLKSRQPIDNLVQARAVQRLVDHLRTLNKMRLMTLCGRMTMSSYQNFYSASRSERDSLFVVVEGRRYEER